jgi:subtilisin family serine protease
VQVPSGDPAEPIAHYCYAQGTSMASPHVTGVAALILSHVDHEKAAASEGEHATSRLQTLINRTANPIACPSAEVQALYAFFPSVNNGAAQTCTGTLEYNSWYGHGEVNALKAVRERDD